jgi:polysaccharide deacetylase 2 family uncharacterized protein YibQ
VHTVCTAHCRLCIALQEKNELNQLTSESRNSSKNLLIRTDLTTIEISKQRIRTIISGLREASTSQAEIKRRRHEAVVLIKNTFGIQNYKVYCQLIANNTIIITLLLTGCVATTIRFQGGC